MLVQWSVVIQYNEIVWIIECACATLLLLGQLKQWDVFPRFNCFVVFIFQRVGEIAQSTLAKTTPCRVWPFSKWKKYIKNKYAHMMLSYRGDRLPLHTVGRWVSLYNSNGMKVHPPINLIVPNKDETIVCVFVQWQHCERFLKLNHGCVRRTGCWTGNKVCLFFFPEMWFIANLSIEDFSLLFSFL